MYNASTDSLLPIVMADSNWKVIATDDFNKDGNPDLLWQNAATGDTAIWYMNNTAQLGGGYTTPNNMGDPAWKIYGTGDFNSDGSPDILFQNRTTGAFSLWYMNDALRTGTTDLNPASLADLSWEIAGIADFNADGKPDILWRNTANGENWVWLMNGTTMTGAAQLASVPGANWSIGGR